MVQEPVIEAARGVKLSLRVRPGLGVSPCEWDILRCSTVEMVEHQINIEGSTVKAHDRSVELNVILNAGVTSSCFLSWLFKDFNQLGL